MTAELESLFYDVTADCRLRGLQSEWDYEIMAEFIYLCGGYHIYDDDDDDNNDEFDSDFSDDQHGAD